MTHTPALLSLMQWLSPAFPTGAYAYSHGMEWAISCGDLVNAAQVQAWLSDILCFGAGWQDAVLVKAALAAGADHLALADWAVALAASAERYAETTQQGEAFALAARALGIEVATAPLPVAFGQAAATLDLPAEQVIALYLHSFTANLVSVAVRFVPLGQNEGQKILARLHPLIATQAQAAARAALDDITTASLRADLAAMHHETMDVRIYRT